MEQTAASAALAAALLELALWEQETRRQDDAVRRWEERLALAERYAKEEVSTAAAERVRRHAGLALAARHEAARQRERSQLLRNQAVAHRTPHSAYND